MDSSTQRQGVEKTACRAGLPQESRRRAWAALTGVSTNTAPASSATAAEDQARAWEQQEHYYRASLREVFGNLDPLPSKIFRIPFLGVEPAVLPEEATVLLAQPSIAVSAAHDRIICVLAQLHSLRYCPQVPNLALILLGFLSESETFSAMEALLRRNKEMPMLLLSKRDETAFIKTFRTLVKSYYPQLSAHLEALGAPVRAIFASWFRGFFTGWLPIEDVHRVVDAYLFEGPKVLIRFGLALLKIAKRKLKATPNGGDIDRVFRRWVARSVVRRLVAAGAPVPPSVPPHLVAELASPASADPLLPDDYSFALLSETAFNGISGLSRSTITKLMDKYLAATAPAPAPAGAVAAGAASSGAGAVAAAGASGAGAAGSSAASAPQTGRDREGDEVLTINRQNSVVTVASAAGGPAEAALAGSRARALSAASGSTSVGIAGAGAGGSGAPGSAIAPGNVTEYGVVYDALGVEPGEDPAASALLGVWYNPKVVGVGTRLMSLDFSPCEAGGLVQRMRGSIKRLREDMYIPQLHSHGMGSMGSVHGSSGGGVGGGHAGPHWLGVGAGGSGASAAVGLAGEPGGTGMEAANESTMTRTAGWLSALRHALGFDGSSGGGGSIGSASGAGSRRGSLTGRGGGPGLGAAFLGPAADGAAAAGGSGGHRSVFEVFGQPHGSSSSSSSAGAGGPSLAIHAPGDAPASTDARKPLDVAGLHAGEGHSAELTPSIIRELAIGPVVERSTAPDRSSGGLATGFAAGGSSGSGSGSGAIISAGPGLSSVGVSRGIKREPVSSVAFSVASSPHLASLCTLLPQSVAAVNWTCVYSTDVHGWSLDTLYNLAAGFAPVMLIVQAQIRSSSSSGAAAASGGGGAYGSTSSAIGVTTAPGSPAADGGAASVGGSDRADATTAAGATATALRLATAVSSKRPVFGFFASRGLRPAMAAVGGSSSSASSSSGSGGAPTTAQAGPVAYGGRTDFLFQLFPELNVFPVSNLEVELPGDSGAAAGTAADAGGDATGRSAASAAAAAGTSLFAPGVGAADLLGTGHLTVLHRDSFLSCLPEFLCIGGTPGKAGAHALRLSRDLQTAVAARSFLADMSVPLHDRAGGGGSGSSSGGVDASGSTPSTVSEVPLDILAVEAYAFIDRAGSFMEAPDAALSRAALQAKRAYLQRLDGFWKPEAK